MDLGSALAITGWFVQVIFDKSLSAALHAWASRSGFQDGVETLRLSLRNARTVLSAAQRAIDINNTQAEELLEWVKQLKEVAYEADDLLDELDYLRLCEQVEGPSKSQLQHVISLKLKAAKDVVRQAGDYLSLKRCHSCMCLCGATIDHTSSSKHATRTDAMAAKPPQHILDQSPQQIRDRINTIVQRLDRVTDGAKGALKLLPIPMQGEIKGERLTSSMLATQDKKIYGRDTEKNMIIELLLKPVDNGSTSSGVGTIHVLPIVGIGGVGKTTLAQLVYNDERISDYFQRKIWVCVSDNFNLIRLTREILEATSGGEKKYGGITNFDTLQVMLRNKLQEMRFLLVLDDTWEDEKKREWEILCAPLKFGKEGSKILVTTRLDSVVRMMGTMDPIKVKGLKEDDFRSLFKACAFGNEDPNAHPKLEKIGRDIASKLEGSPLAAKMLGDLLKDKLDDEHWISILNSNIWELRQGPDDLFPVLRLSYQHLPVHLQQCFAYCGIFPKYFNYHYNVLIPIWLAVGFVPSQNGNISPEVVGKAYFDDLVFKSFFQVLERDGDIYYVMHSLLHDLASFVAGDEYSRIEAVGLDKVDKVQKTVRHLAIWNTSLVEVKHNLSKLMGLRTLIVLAPSLPNSDFIVLQKMMKENLRSLRVLLLIGFRIEKMSDTIGQLIHLRYLCFENSCIKEFSDSLCKLYHLQFLTFPDCAHGKFPSGITNLINLRALGTDNSEAICNIARFGKLTALQSLQRFRVGKARGYEIGQLKDMGELRGSLCIENLENVETKAKALQAGLEDKKHLRDLSLCWSSSQRSGGPHIEEEVLEGLHPHPLLKELNIISYSGARSPSWLVWNQCTNLESLHLIDCSKLEDLPPLGSLPFLKVLRIQGGRAVRKVGCDFFGSGEVRGFPFLELLHLEDMPELEEWCDIEDSRLFPRLHKVLVEDCPKLIGIPCLPPSLKDLHIENVGLTVLPGWRCRGRSHEETAASSSNDANMISSSSSALSSLFISECPKLRSLAEGLLSQPNRFHLCCLQRLDIQFCEELVSLPWEGLRELTSLTKLCITRCPKLEFVMPYKQEEESGRPFLLPSSLVDLRIVWCGALTIPLPKCLRGLTSLAKLVIIGWQHITTLPSAKALHHLTALQELHIQDCQELTSIGGLRALASLQEVYIVQCPKLTSASSGLGSGSSQIEGKRDEGLSSLHRLGIDEPLLLRLVLTEEGFASLRQLHIEVCSSPQLVFSGDGEGEVVLQCLISLSHLEILHCPRLTSLPSAELLTHLTALQELEISDCPELASVGGLRALVSLQRLSVINCPRLTAAAVGEGTSSSLYRLRIDDPSLLRVLLQKQGLSSLQRLGIAYNPQLRSLTGQQLEAFHYLTSLQFLSFVACANLQSLPADLKPLTSLKYLSIQECPKIQSLPDKKGLPASLEYVYTNKCNPVLKERYQFAKFPVPIGFE